MWARAKRPTPCSDWFTEKPFPELDAHRLGEDVLATILHRKCSNQSVEVGSRRGLSPLRRCSAPGRSCFECVTPSSVHSSPKSTGLRGKIGMIRCVFLRSTNVSVVSNIVVTEMIEKIHPRHFLNEKVQEWWVTIYFSTQSAGDKVFWPRLWGDILITFFFRVTIYHNGGNLGVTINVTPTK